MEESQVLHSSLFVQEKEQRYERILFQHVLYFQAEGGWVDLITTQKEKKYRISTNIGSVAPQLNPTVFVRISRKHIVNIHHVVALQGNLVFVGSEALLMGRHYKDDLLRKLPILRTKNTKMQDE